MRHFTDSTTFDVNFLLNGKTEKAHKNNKNRSFNNEAMFDVENLTKLFKYLQTKIRPAYAGLIFVRLSDIFMYVCGEA